MLALFEPRIPSFSVKTSHTKSKRKLELYLLSGCHDLGTEDALHPGFIPLRHFVLVGVVLDLIFLCCEPKLHEFVLDNSHIASDGLACKQGSKYVCRYVS